MKEINASLFNASIEIGDVHPTIIMGVLNLSPESFYKGSIYENPKILENAVNKMINNGAKMLDLGARSTAPWSKSISVEEEVERIMPAMNLVCKLIPKEVIISVDTQYSSVAEKAHEIALKHDRKIVINDVSCLKTDPTLADFIIDNKIPIILMASRKIPGDLCTINKIIDQFKISIQELKNKGYDENLIILDPGIGKWIKEKTIRERRRINQIMMMGSLTKGAC